MPRKQREITDQGIYHIFNRGNNRRNLFIHEGDFQTFYDLLLMYKNTYNFRLYHYCMMNNHYHMLIQVQKGRHLSLFMHRLQLSYVRYYKKAYQFIGHVFQERFRSPRIPEESYYLQCGRYIEQNPLKAGMVTEPWRYKWSSAVHYALGNRDRLITPNLYYEELGKTAWDRQAEYRHFLKLDEPYAPFIETMLAKV